MQLRQSSSVNRVLSNTSWLAAEKAITMLVSLAIGIFLARSLGPETWGRLNYLLAIVAILGPFTSLGLNAIVTREIVNQPDAADKIVITALGYRLLGSVIGTALCLVGYTWYIGGDSRELSLVLVLLLSSIFSTAKVTEYWFQAQMLNKYIACLRLSIFMLFSLIKVGAVLLNAEFWQLMLVFAAEFVVVGLGYLVLYHLRNQPLEPRLFDLSYGWSLLKQSLWLVLGGLAAVLYLKIDQIMLAKMLGNDAVGIYSVAVRLSEVWFFFPAAFAASVFPVLLRSRTALGGNYQQKLQICCDVLLYSALLVTIAVTLLAPFFVPLLFGRQYVDSASVLTIHVWGGLFVFMRELVSKWLISESLLPYSLWSHGMGALVNLVLNILLIPIYGYWGAAYATVISYFVSGYLCFWVFPKTRFIALVMTRSIFLPVNWHKPFRINPFRDR